MNHCTSCHRSDNGLGAISEGHVAAAAQQYHVDSYLIEGVGLSQVCLNCHDEESGKPEAPPANQAFPAHGSHPVGTEIPKSSPWESSAFREVISPQLELFDDNIECITCHRIPEPAVFRLVPFPTVTDLCNGCHDMAPGIPPPVAAMGPAVTRLNSPTQLVGSYGPINH